MAVITAKNARNTQVSIRHPRAGRVIHSSSPSKFAAISRYVSNTAINESGLKSFGCN